MLGGSHTPPLQTRYHSTRKQIILIIEIGLCRYLGCDVKFAKKTEKYSPLIAALEKFKGSVVFVAFPIRHAGTTLASTIDHLTTAFSTVRPPVERARANMGIIDPTTDHNARIYGCNIFKSLMDSITDFAQSRLFGVISNKKRLVDVQLLAPTPAARQQGAATRTHLGRAQHASRRAPPSLREVAPGRCKLAPRILFPSYPCPI